MPALDIDRSLFVCEDLDGYSDAFDRIKTNLPYGKFFGEYLVPNRPCVIESVSNEWLIQSEWVSNGKPNFNYLRSNYGNTTVPIANCTRQYHDSHAKTQLHFHDFLDYWEEYIQDEYPANSQLLYLKDWHLFLEYPTRHYEVPDYFASDWLNEFFLLNGDLKDDYRFVYMGPKGSWTPLHKDVYSSYSWSVNLCGTKEWIFYPPQQEPMLMDKHGKLPYDVTGTLNETDYPNINLTTPIYLTQKTGEAVFVPSGWFHQVQNTEDTISVNHNWINSCNIMTVYRNMLIEFVRVKEELKDCADASDWDFLCQNLLNATFGMNFVSFLQFLNFICERRFLTIDSRLPLPVPSAHCFSLRHVIYDIFAIKEVLEDMVQIVECPHDGRLLLDLVIQSLAEHGIQSFEDELPN